MSKSRRRIAHAALLASASFLSLTIASPAQAQCVPTPTQPLNNITTDSTVVSCTGSVNGPVITVNANGTNVDTNGSGTFVTGANINVTGNSNVVQVRNGAVLNGSQITLTGAGNTVLYGGGAISNGSIVNISGANSQLLFLSGSQVTQNPGQTTISALAGEQNTILISAGGGLFTTGGNGQYLLVGGTGNQNVQIEGFLVAPSDGLAISLGDGDDRIDIGSSANISTQASGAALFDGGAGNDIFSININGSWIHDTVGFEIININPNTAITLTGSNVDAVQFNVQGGSVTVTSGAALGVANSTVDIGQFGTLTLGYTASASFDNTLTGSGGLKVDASGATITFGGNGSGYTGAVNITNGTTAVLGNANAVGAGAITNDGTISWGDFNLANDIGGTGGLIYTGVGTGDLSGANSFSGGIDIQSGSLRVTNVGALGTGTITTTTGGVILQMDTSGNQVLANNLTGALVLAKTSGGILDVTGTNTYTGGTLIDDGAIRVDDFARLGTGQVIANANGSLILNY
ncbi:MAG: autotransporter-associated beta strand repeat-containing protein, partial [Erythrobacter sp.]|uniref:autotransporter-associated beta strand repeat-containing protein n=1 Tax=Erythrobacter sp. TaxID=1042 RepID=UPI0025D0BE89